MYGNEKWTAEGYGYNTALGKLASTTGNVYGIYDTCGGGWEKVAAFLDNGNQDFDQNGNSKSEKYFENVAETYYKLKTEYEKYWDIYEVSDDEKQNKKILVNGTEKTQNDLYSVAASTEEDEQKRYELSIETWNKLEKKKGIGMNEVAGSWSYRTVVGTDKKQMGFKTDPDSEDVNYGLAWNEDRILIGCSWMCFVSRGRWK